MSVTGSFGQTVRHCEWIFDLFASGFDHLGKYHDVPRHAAHRRAVAMAEELSRAFVEPIQAADGGIPEVLREYLRVPETRDGKDGSAEPTYLERLAIALRIIDKASRPLNHLHGYYDSSVWEGVRRHMFFNEQRLNSSSVGRHVVLKPSFRFPAAHHPDAWWKTALKTGQVWDSRPRGQHWSREFANLCCVPELPGFILEHLHLSPTQDFGVVDWSKLRIGVVPLIEEIAAVTADGASMRPGPLRITTNSDNEIVVDIHGPGMETLCRHAAKAVRYLAEREVQIILFPEAVVPDPVVDAIRSELTALSGAGCTYPSLVLAGTFVRGGADGATGHNEAIVFNGGGVEVFRQRKLHAYEMQVHEQRLYGLEPVFGGKPAIEEITTRPRTLVFCDSPATGTRVVVMICEDSAQEDPCLHAARGMHPNLVLIPVMAGALMADRGFAKTAGALALAPGCLTVVANSGALPRAERRNGAKGSDEDPHPPPLGIVGLPGLTLFEDKRYRHFTLLRDVLHVDAEGPQVLLFECPT